MKVDYVAQGVKNKKIELDAFVKKLNINHDEILYLGDDLNDESIMKIVGFSAYLSCCDIDNFEMPQGRLAVYLFNPFGEERMTRLVKQFCDRDFETLVIYHNPKLFTNFNENHKIKEIVWNHFGLYKERAYLYLIPANSQN